MPRSFNGFNFDDGATYKVLTIDAFSIPPRTLFGQEFARRDGGKLLATRYGQKGITIEGIVRGTSPADVLANVDTLHGSLSPAAGTLKTHLGAEGRYYLATLERFAAPVGQREYNYAYWSARFKAASPFAYAAAGSSQGGTPTFGSVDVGEFAGTFTLPTAPATAPCEPTHTLTIGTADYGITKLWLQNASLSPPLKAVLNQTFSGAGTVVINARTFAITVNGSAAPDTKGAFPLLDPAAGTGNSFEIHCEATATPSMSYLSEWTARYLT